MKEYLIEKIEAVPSSKWFFEDADEQVVEFFYLKMLTAVLLYPSAQIFSVVPERGRRFLLRIEEDESFTFLLKQGKYEETIIDVGEITARSTSEGKFLFFAEAEYMERYRFFCVESTI